MSQMSLTMRNSSADAVGEYLKASIGRPSGPGAFPSLSPLRQVWSSSSVRWSSGHTVVSRCDDMSMLGCANFAVRSVELRD